MKKGVVITIIIIFAVIIISVVAYLIYKNSEKKKMADAQNQLLVLQAQLANPATTIPEKANIITQIGNLAALLQNSGVNLNLKPNLNLNTNTNTNTNTNPPAIQPPGFPVKKALGFNILAQNLQKGLNLKCGSKLVPDGKFGSLTESALMKCYSVNQADFALYNQIIS